MVADILLQKPQTEQLYLPDGKASIASQWLCANEPYYNVKQYVDKAIDAL